MSIDGKLLAGAIARHDGLKADAERDRARRMRIAFAASPRLREIDGELRSAAASAIEAALRSDGSAADAVDAAGRRSLELQREQERELGRLGFPRDYLDERPMCPKCGDRGFVGAEICACLLSLYREEQRASLSSLLRLGDDSFDAFDAGLYDDTPDARTGVSPRRSMEMVYEICVNYARKFGPKSMNLFFTGSPGLGKTFLSACIARVVSEKGNSVVYDTAAAIFSRFEEQKFNRTGDSDAADAEIIRYNGCDLLIMDDLGAEMTTAFTVSALHALINTRLTAGKKTVISSNLTTDELKTRYSPAIASRLEGEYQALRFYGDDIRLKKKGIQ
ncbi:MAG: ATP-binding protein [Oscillospiraceae bacterium]|jgi:DNA replication protein DnaC|nr:ATP-binding protein [Oscillospiraceae bacterium]